MQYYLKGRENRCVIFDNNFLSFFDILTHDRLGTLEFYNMFLSDRVYK